MWIPGLLITSLTVESGLLPEGQTVDFFVSAKVPGKAEGSSSNSFYTDVRPFGGNCKVTPSEGMAKVDNNITPRICTII